VKPGEDEDLVAGAETLERLRRPGMHLEPGVGRALGSLPGTPRRSLSDEWITPMGRRSAGAGVAFSVMSLSLFLRAAFDPRAHRLSRG
jgi:hypothetical protein